MITQNDIFFIGSAWGSGTGFIVDGYDFIITTVQTVGFSKSVIIKNKQISKQVAKVLFADYSTGLAFIEKHENINANLNVLDFEMAVIEQIVNIYETNYYNELNILKSEVTDNKFKQNNINYLLLKNKNNNTSGGVVINTKNELVGIIKHIDSSGDNIVLPAKYILKGMEEFSVAGELAIRCTNCQNVVSTAKIIDHTCPICSADVMIEFVNETLPAQTITDKEIETALLNLGHDINNCRIGHHIWEINKGSASIIIRYHPELKFIVAFSPFCVLNSKNNDEIYKFILSENKNIEYLSFSINKNKVFLSSPYIVDDDFDEHIAKTIFEDLFEKADFYDDIILKMIK